jgi:hypothetical protein
MSSILTAVLQHMEGLENRQIEVGNSRPAILIHLWHERRYCVISMEVFPVKEKRIRAKGGNLFVDASRTPFKREKRIPWRVAGSKNFKGRGFLWMHGPQLSWPGGLPAPRAFGSGELYCHCQDNID